MLQNTTFGGVQGFTRKPSTPWWDRDGRWSGIVHQERNWTYALFYGAGHEVPADQPTAVCHLRAQIHICHIDVALPLGLHLRAAIPCREQPDRVGRELEQFSERRWR